MREMDLPKTPEPMDAGEQLDAIIALGRVPNPMDSRELPAHTERIRRRLAETPPPAQAQPAAQRRADSTRRPLQFLIWRKHLTR